MLSGFGQPGRAAKDVTGFARLQRFEMDARIIGIEKVFAVAGNSGTDDGIVPRIIRELNLPELGSRDANPTIPADQSLKVSTTWSLSERIVLSGGKGHGWPDGFGLVDAAIGLRLILGLMKQCRR